MAIILDGKQISAEIAAELKVAIASLGFAPKLAIVQIGENAESDAYVGAKKRFAEKIGAHVEHVRLPADVSLQDAAERIKTLDADPSVHGIIIQLPIPAHLDRLVLIAAISPRKDVDGLTAQNIRLLFENRPGGHVPATAKGIVSLLKRSGIVIEGAKAVVVGRSALVGKPTALLLSNLNATVTLCHSKTPDLSRETKSAVILVVAVGKPGFITAEHLAPGQVVIDVGISLNTGQKLEEEIPQRTLVGDVDFEAAKGIVYAISPVPGGVGPMTVASLFENLVAASKGLSS